MYLKESEQIMIVGESREEGEIGQILNADSKASYILLDIIDKGLLHWKNNETYIDKLTKKEKVSVEEKLRRHANKIIPTLGFFPEDHGFKEWYAPGTVSG